MSISAVAPINVAVIVGALIAEPTNKILRSGEVVTSFLLKVHPEGGTATTVPGSWMEATDDVLDFAVGDNLIVHGRVRQQWYSSADRFTDVLATSVVKAKRPSTVRKLLATAMAQLQAVAP